MGLMERIRTSAQQHNKRIVLPEGTEERTLKAANFILQERIARIILIGDQDKIREMAREWKLEKIEQTTIIDPGTYDRKEEFANMLFEIRKEKGLTMEEALKLVEDPLYLSTLLIKNNEADGEVAGAANATGKVLKPAFQVVRTQPGISVVSGAFLMLFKNHELVPDNILVFADCAVHPDPTDEELAQIAISTAQTAKNIAGIDPRIAMLSFSTRGSANHPMVEKVANATKIVQEREPSIQIDGEFQADAAIVEAVGMHKAPGSPIAGNANVLVFPSLEAGNIGYKLVQRLAGAEAIGPVLQGMAAPINDLSRGCSISDIVNLVAITANQAAAIKHT
ncbi:MAG: phosphate acetyltransferase [Bacteroidales bacterium]|nr:phosphate acetyltransferase [Bacteroidales bacterium]